MDNGVSASQTGPSQQAAEPVVSALRASVPDVTFSGWADQELGQLYHRLECVQDRLSGTAKGCISDALKAVELADEYVAKAIREDDE